METQPIISQMKEEDIDFMAFRYLEQPETFANFSILWHWFLGQLPTPKEVNAFLSQAQELGYTLEDFN